MGTYYDNKQQNKAVLGEKCLNVLGMHTGGATQLDGIKYLSDHVLGCTQIWLEGQPSEHQKGNELESELEPLLASPAHAQKVLPNQHR